MAYAIRIKGSAKQELKRFAKRGLSRIAEAIDALADDPRPHGVEDFRSISNAYRIRVGDFRVVYTVDDEQQIIEIVLVGDRKDVYRRR